ncbi:unnamed protein product [Parnassius apollo]|uniref:(apollo) hypothetical protein n=1 Tax=Parnassius apollo TaxID=110799 RepID=A0A8S3W291_PARAO|nr:unnamed protein product [Parnassius apollo]
MWTQWGLDGPDGALYNRTSSGWFDSITFLYWFTNIIIPWASQLKGTKLVIGDKLSSHLNPDVLDLCEAHEIRFVFLPSRSTQIAKPLDVAFFGPLKKSWREILSTYKIENPNQTTLNKSHFPLLLKKIMDSANTNTENVKSGKETEMYPFNPYQIYNKLPEFEEEIKYDADQSVLHYLKETKQPNPIKRGKNSNLNVPPG